MKKYVLILIVLFSLSANSQSVIGAWERNHVSDNGEALKSVVIFSDGYQSISIFKAKSGEFVYSNGGTWEIDGKMTCWHYVEGFGRKLHQKHII